MHICLIGLSEGIARSVARYVDDNRGFVLCGVAPSLALAEFILPATRATLILLDWSVLAGSSKSGLQALRRGRPGLRIVGVVDDAACYRAAAIESGADAVIVKNALALELETLLHGFFSARSAACGACDE